MAKTIEEEFTCGLDNSKIPLVEVIAVDTILRPHTDIIIEIDSVSKLSFVSTLLNKTINNTPLTDLEAQFITYIISELNVGEDTE